MQVGSLIGLVDDNWENKEAIPYFLSKGVRFPVKNVVYTVREFDGDEYIRLEEIVNPKMQFIDGYEEISFIKKRFRELQPPMTISIEQFNQQPEFA